MRYTENLNFENVNHRESLAAKEYFSNLYPGLNRRIDEPFNSRLNYGYAVLRSAIVRSLVATGFHPAFGLHHSNQLNTCNLADDLIEPWRAMVDLIAIKNTGSNLVLTKNERYRLAHVLHNECIIRKKKMPILVAIDEMCENMKRCYLSKNRELLELPTIVNINSMELINE